MLNMSLLRKPAQVKCFLLLAVVAVSVGAARLASHLVQRASPQVPSSSGPSLGLVFRPASIDLGQISVGEQCRHRVLLYNLADTTIKISGITSSCSCTTTDFSGNILDPGESLPMEVLFDSDFKFGKLELSVAVKGYLDGDNVPVEALLPVKVEVERDQYADPETVDLKALPIGATAGSTLALHRKKATDWQLSLERPSIGVAGVGNPDSIPDQVSLEPIAHQRGTSCNAILKVTPGAPAGSRGYTIRIHSGAKGAPPMSVFVKYSVQSLYDVEPLKVVFARVDPMGGSVPAKVRIRSKTPNVEGALSIASVPPWAKATLTHSEDGALISIEVIARETTKGVLHGAIMLNTDNHLEEVLRIPILALVR